MMPRIQLFGKKPSPLKPNQNTSAQQKVQQIEILSFPSKKGLSPPPILSKLQRPPQISISRPPILNIERSSESKLQRPSQLKKSPQLKRPPELKLNRIQLHTSISLKKIQQQQPSHQRRSNSIIQNDLPINHHYTKVNHTKSKKQTQSKSSSVQKQKQSTKLNHLDSNKSLQRQRHPSISLNKRQTVNSITSNNNNTISNPNLIQFPQHEQSQSPTFPRLLSKQSHNFNNKYLSIASLPSLPQDYRYRPSDNRKVKYNNKNNNNQVLDDGNQDFCEQCQYEGQMDTVFKLGWIAYSWMVFLFMTTVVLFWVPFIFKNYQQRQLVCPECGAKVKTIKPTCI